MQDNKGVQVMFNEKIRNQKNLQNLQETRAENQ